MNENFNGMNGENSVYRPINVVSIQGMNNRTYIYSQVNEIKVYGTNQEIFCNYINSRVNSINLNGMNNIVYINHNSQFCRQNICGFNNRIIFTEIQNENNMRNNPANINQSLSGRVLGGSSFLSGSNQDNNNNLNNISNNNLNNSRNVNNNLNNSNNNYNSINNSNNHMNNEDNIDRNQNSNRINNEEGNRSLPFSDSMNFNILSSSNIVNREIEFLYEKRFEHDIIDDEKCNICNTKFKNDDIITKMECGHIYHKFCQDKFKERQINNANYPLCFICFQWELQDSINKRGN